MTIASAADQKLKVINEVLDRLTDLEAEHLPLLQDLAARLKLVGQGGGAAGTCSGQYATALSHLERMIKEIPQEASSVAASRMSLGGPGL